jgi:hypothetical protein
MEESDIVQYARMFPRIGGQIHVEVMSTIHRDTEGLIYVTARDGKIFDGPSIRFAEMLMQAWRNCTISSVITEITKTHVRVTGRFFDAQTLIQTDSEILAAIPKRDSVVIGSVSLAAASKARRNAILSGIPRTVWEPFYSEIKTLMRKDRKRLKLAIKGLADFGITIPMLSDHLGIDLSDTATHALAIRAIYMAVVNNEMSTFELTPKSTAVAATENRNPLDD